jgi:hypothetical protein
MTDPSKYILELLRKGAGAARRRGTDHYNRDDIATDSIHA